MVGKAPAFQFYPGDWERDLEEHSLEIEGAWIRICCKLWWSPTRGRASKTLEQWGRILRVTWDRAGEILRYLGDAQIATVQGSLEGEKSEVVLISRRMIRDEKIRKIRKKCGFLGGNPGLKNRNNNAGKEILVNQNPTTLVNQNPTPSVFSLHSSASNKEEKKEYKKEKIIPKLTFGEFQNVFLADKEHETLLRDFAEEKTGEMIEILSSALASNKRLNGRYTSHYAVIRNWERRGWMEGKKRGLVY